jgi:hypothetical protein
MTHRTTSDVRPGPLWYTTLPEAAGSIESIVLGGKQWDKRQPCIRRSVTTIRCRQLFEQDTIAGFLVPWPTSIQDGQAQLKIYSDVFSLRYGADRAQAPRFVTYPISCPTGHNFGVMWTNKENMTIQLCSVSIRLSSNVKTNASLRGDILCR